MGRCVACNKALSDQEATRKGVNTGEYLDLCNHCFSTIADEFPYIEGHGGRTIEEEEDYGDGEDWQNSFSRGQND